jgi:hypothetical protein
MMGAVTYETLDYAVDAGISRSPTEELVDPGHREILTVRASLVQPSRDELTAAEPLAHHSMAVGECERPT